MVLIKILDSGHTDDLDDDFTVGLLYVRELTLWTTNNVTMHQLRRGRCWLLKMKERKIVSNPGIKTEQ